MRPCSVGNSTARGTEKYAVSTGTCELFRKTVVVRVARSRATTSFGTVAEPATISAVEPSATTNGPPHQESYGSSSGSSWPLSGSSRPNHVRPSRSYAHTIVPSSTKANELPPKIQAG